MSAVTGTGRSAVDAPLVGEHGRRLDDLYALYREVEREGRSRAVVLHGPSGRGKTRIVQELALRLAAEQDPALADEMRAELEIGSDPARADRHRKHVEIGPSLAERLPFLWAAVRCDRQADGTPVPAYAGLLHSLGVATAVALKRRELLKAASHLGLGRLAEATGMIGTLLGAAGDVRSAVDLVRGVADRSVGDRITGEQLREQLATRLAVANARARPGVLLVDDAHFADAATVDLVTGLLQPPPRVQSLLKPLERWTRRPLLVVLTTWDHTLGAEPVATMVEGLAATALTPPATLDRDATAHLAETLARAADVASSVAREVAAQVASAAPVTGANPHAVVGVVADLVRAYLLTGSVPDGAGIDLTARLGEDLRHRWQLLDEPVVARLVQLSRAGQAFAPEVVLRLTGAEHDDVVAALRGIGALEPEDHLLRLDPAFGSLLDEAAGAAPDDHDLLAPVRAALGGAVEDLLGLDAMDPTSWDRRLRTTLQQLARVASSADTVGEAWAHLVAPGADGRLPDVTLEHVAAAPPGDRGAAWAAVFLPADTLVADERLRRHARAGLVRAAARPTTSLALAAVLRDHSPLIRHVELRSTVLRRHVTTSVQAAEQLLRVGMPADRQSALSALCDIHLRQQPERLVRLARRLEGTELSRVLDVADDLAHQHPTAARVLAESTDDERRERGAEALAVLLDAETGPGGPDEPPSRTEVAAAVAVTSVEAVFPRAARPGLVRGLRRVAAQDEATAAAFVGLPWPEAWPAALEVVRLWSGSPTVVQHARPPQAHAAEVERMLVRLAEHDESVARHLVRTSAPGTARRTAGATALGRLAAAGGATTTALLALRLPDCSAAWPAVEQVLLGRVGTDPALARALSLEGRFRGDTRVVGALEQHAGRHLAALGALARGTHGTVDAGRLRALLRGGRPVHQRLDELLPSDVPFLLPLLAPTDVERLARVSARRAVAPTWLGSRAAQVLGALAQVRPELREQARTSLLLRLTAGDGTHVAMALTRLSGDVTVLRACADTLLAALRRSPEEDVLDALSSRCRSVLTHAEHREVVSALELLAPMSGTAALLLLERWAGETDRRRQLHHALSSVSADARVACGLVRLGLAGARAVLPAHAPTSPAALRALAASDPALATEVATSSPETRPAGLAVLALQDTTALTLLRARGARTTELKAVELARDALAGSLTRRPSRPEAWAMVATLTGATDPTLLGRVMSADRALGRGALGDAVLAAAAQHPVALEVALTHLWALPDRVTTWRERRLGLLDLVSTHVAAQPDLAGHAARRAVTDEERRALLLGLLPHLDLIREADRAAVAALVDEGTEPAAATAVREALGDTTLRSAEPGPGGARVATPRAAVLAARQATVGTSGSAAARLAPWVPVSAEAALAAVQLADRMPAEGEAAVQVLGADALALLRQDAADDITAACALWRVDRAAALAGLRDQLEREPAAAAALLRRWDRLDAHERQTVALPLERAAVSDLHVAAALVLTRAPHDEVVPRVLLAHADRTEQLALLLVGARISVAHRAVVERVLPGTRSVFATAVAAADDAWALVHACLLAPVAERTALLRDAVGTSAYSDLLRRTSSDPEALEVVAGTQVPAAYAHARLHRLRDVLRRGGTDTVGVLARTGPTELRQAARARLGAEERAGDAEARRALLGAVWDRRAAARLDPDDIHDAVVLAGAAERADAWTALRRSSHLPALVLRGLVPEQRLAAAASELRHRAPAVDVVVALLQLVHLGAAPRAAAAAFVPGVDAAALVAAASDQPGAALVLRRAMRTLRGRPEADPFIAAAMDGASDGDPTAALLADGLLHADDPRGARLAPALRRAVTSIPDAAVALARRAATGPDAAAAVRALRLRLADEPDVRVPWCRAAALVAVLWPRHGRKVALPSGVEKDLLDAASSRPGLLADLAVLVRTAAIQTSPGTRSRVRSLLRVSPVAHPACRRERLGWGVAGSDEVDACLRAAAEDDDEARLALLAVDNASARTVQVLDAVRAVLALEDDRDLAAVCRVLKNRTRSPLPGDLHARLTAAASRSGHVVDLLARRAGTDDEVLALARRAARLPLDERTVVARSLVRADPGLRDVLAPVGSPQRTELHGILAERATAGDADAARRLGELVLVERRRSTLFWAGTHLRPFLRTDLGCAETARELALARKAGTAELRAIGRAIDALRERKAVVGPAAESPQPRPTPTVAPVAAPADPPEPQDVRARLHAALAHLGHRDPLRADALATLGRLGRTAPATVAVTALAARLHTGVYVDIAAVLSPDAGTFAAVRCWEGSTRAAILGAWLAQHHDPRMLADARVRLRDALDDRAAPVAVRTLAALASTDIEELEARARYEQSAGAFPAQWSEPLPERVAGPQTGRLPLAAALQLARAARLLWWRRRAARSALLPHVLEDPAAATALAHLAIDDGERREALTYLTHWGRADVEATHAGPGADDLRLLAARAVLAPRDVPIADHDRLVVALDDCEGLPADLRADVAAAALALGRREVAPAVLDLLPAEWSLATRLLRAAPESADDVLSRALEAPAEALDAVLHALPAHWSPPAADGARATALAVEGDAGSRHTRWAAAVDACSQAPELLPWLAGRVRSDAEHRSLDVVLRTSSDEADEPSAPIALALARCARTPTQLRLARRALAEAAGRWPAQLAQGLVDDVPEDRLPPLLVDAPEALLDMLVELAETSADRARTVATALASVAPERAPAARRALVEFAVGDAEVARAAVAVISAHGGAEERRTAAAVLTRTGLVTPTETAPLVVDVATATDASQGVGARLAAARSPREALAAFAAWLDIAHDGGSRSQAVRELLGAEPHGPALARAVPPGSPELWEIGNALATSRPEGMSDEDLVVLGHLTERRSRAVAGEGLQRTADQRRELRQRAPHDPDVALALARFTSTRLEQLEAAAAAEYWADRGHVGAACRLMELADTLDLPEHITHRARILVEAYRSVDEDALPVLARVRRDPGTRAAAWRLIAAEGLAPSGWLPVVSEGTTVENTLVAPALLAVAQSVPEAAVALAVSGVPALAPAAALFLEPLRDTLDPWHAATLLIEVSRAPGVGADPTALGPIVHAACRDARAAALVLLHAGRHLPLSSATTLADICLADDVPWVVAAACHTDRRAAAVDQLVRSAAHDARALHALAPWADAASWHDACAAAPQARLATPEAVARCLLVTSEPDPDLLAAVERHVEHDFVRMALVLAASGDGEAAVQRVPGTAGARLAPAMRFLAVVVARPRG